MTKRLVGLYDFSGRSVCVTGAASGIGYATALLFADLGASVIAADRNADGLDALARERPGRIKTATFDQAKRASVEAFAGEVSGVDVLINNAGILLYEP